MPTGTWTACLQIITPFRFTPSSSPSAPSAAQGPCCADTATATANATAAAAIFGTPPSGPLCLRFSSFLLGVVLGKFAEKRRLHRVRDTDPF